MAINQFDFFAFIETIIDSMREVHDIDSVTDNANGTYTVETALTTNLVNGQSITILGSSVFVDQYQIDSVIDDTSFILVKKFSESEGLTSIDPGLNVTETELQWKAKAPYFWHNRADKLNVRLDNLANSPIKTPVIAVIETTGTFKKRAEFQNNTDSGKFNYVVSGIEMIFATNYKTDWVRSDYESIYSEMELLFFKFRKTILALNSTTSIVNLKSYEFGNVDLYPMPEMEVSNGETFDALLCGIVTQPFEIRINEAGEVC